MYKQCYETYGISLPNSQIQEDTKQILCFIKNNKYNSNWIIMKYPSIYICSTWLSKHRKDFDKLPIKAVPSAFKTLSMYICSQQYHYHFVKVKKTLSVMIPVSEICHSLYKIPLCQNQSNAFYYLKLHKN